MNITIVLTISNDIQVAFSQGYIPPPSPPPPQPNNFKSQSIQCPQIAFTGPTYNGPDGCPKPCPTSGDIPNGCPISNPSPTTPTDQNQQNNLIGSPQGLMPQNNNLLKPNLIVGGIDLSKIPGLNNTREAGVAPTLDNAPNSTNSNNVKIVFTGTVTQVDDRANELNGIVKVGDEITGEYTFKLSTKDTNTDQTVGDYTHDKRAFGITVNAGGLVFKTDPKNVNFLVELVNRGTDHYLLRSYNNLPLSGSVRVEQISWQLDDETGNALSSDSLKTAPNPPVLQNWKDLFGLTITGGDNRGGGDPSQSFFIRAHIDSVK